MLKQLSCRICENKNDNHILSAREMMFGTREAFNYIECSNCGCLQIVEIPKDMSKYYPSKYFSVRSIHRTTTAKSLTKRAALKVNRVLPKNILPSYVLTAFEQPFVINLVRDFHLNSDSKILEVGCGNGGLLLTLLDLGFENVLGLEPYAESKVRDDIPIMNIPIEDLNPESKFDAIVFNHSLEHICNQLSALKHSSTLIARNGICQVRIPVKTNYVWQNFGTNWVQLDPPRHFYLHTVKSLNILARNAGLTLSSVIFDSTEFQFWGTEQYRQDIPLRAKNSEWMNPKESIFSRNRINIYSRTAKRLNKRYQGDQATFYLTKANFDPFNPT